MPTLSQLGNDSSFAGAAGAGDWWSTNVPEFANAAPMNGPSVSPMAGASTGAGAGPYGSTPYVGGAGGFAAPWGPTSNREGYLQNGGPTFGGGMTPGGSPSDFSERAPSGVAPRMDGGGNMQYLHGGPTLGSLGYGVGGEGGGRSWATGSMPPAPYNPWAQWGSGPGMYGTTDNPSAGVAGAQTGPRSPYGGAPTQGGRMMRSPTGEMQMVQPEHVQHYLSKGAAFV